MSKSDATVLESIRCITYSATQFDASVNAMQRYLNYQILESGKIENSLARLWGAEAMTGSRYCLLAPESGADFFIRFIESPATPGYAPLRTYGWNASEFLVQDVYALASELEGSAYSIIGGPRDLMENGAAIALQVAGPSQEVFYFTELNGRSFQNLYGKADCQVDRAFMAILGVQDHKAAIEHYGAAAVSTTKARTFNIRVLANAQGLDPVNTRFDISAAVFNNRYRIELDGYPATTVKRPRLPDYLPPGMCMVSATTSSIEQLALAKSTDQIRGPVQALYSGCNMAMAQGTSDELLELIEIE